MLMFVFVFFYFCLVFVYIAVLYTWIKCFKSTQIVMNPATYCRQFLAHLLHANEPAPAFPIHWADQMCAGVLVTLSKQPETPTSLLGHGYCINERMLLRCLQQATYNAAFMDRNSAPMRPNDMNNVTVRVSVMHSVKFINEYHQWAKSTHGLVLIWKSPEHSHGRLAVVSPQALAHAPGNHHQIVDMLISNMKLYTLPHYCKRRAPFLYRFETTNYTC